MGHRLTHITLVNGVETSAVCISDRGLAYGDGLFETMRIVKGAIPLLSWHAQRLMFGVKKLDLGSRTRLADTFRKQVAAVAAGFHHGACLKYMLTRGTQGSGYAPPLHAELNEIIQVFELPEWSDEYYSTGVRTKLCHHRLPSRSALAGIKHLNRLDQVMASHELSGEQEGLLFDFDDRLIEGTRSNVMLLEQGQLLTPALEHAGVKGTLRQFLMDHQNELGTAVKEAQIDRQRLLNAEAVFLINSLFGVWPVRSIDDSEIAMNASLSQQLRRFVQQRLGFYQGTDLAVGTAANVH